MSDVKHQPATPLPFKYVEERDVPSNRNFIERDGGPIRTVVAQQLSRHGFKGDTRKDFEYLTHAANAYPKLVEALLKANQFLHDNAPEEDETLALTSTLLRDLGEAS